MWQGDLLGDSFYRWAKDAAEGKRAAEEEAVKRAHEAEVLAHMMRTEEAVRSLEESHGHAVAVRTRLVRADAVCFVYTCRRLIDLSTDCRYRRPLRRSAR